MTDSSNQERTNLRGKVIKTLIRLRSEGKNIYSGVFYGFNPAEVQLSCTKTIDGNTSVTYGYYSKVYQFIIESKELEP